MGLRGIAYHFLDLLQEEIYDFFTNWLNRAKSDVGGFSE
jgi:hypothetical protein